MAITSIRVRGFELCHFELCHPGSIFRRLKGYVYAVLTLLESEVPWFKISKKDQDRLKQARARAYA
jgi:hypothetical protein